MLKRSGYLGTLTEVALLIAASVAVFDPSVRFITTTEEVLNKLDFRSPTHSWRMRGKPLGLETEDGTVIRILATQVASYVGRVIERPQRFKFLRIRAEVRSQDLEGEKPWHGGTLALLSYGGSARYTTHWPRRVVRLDGTHGWRSVDQFFPVSPVATQLFLVAYAAGSQGHLEFKRLAVTAAAERVPVRYARYALVALWLGLWVWLFKCMIHRAERSPLRLTVFLAANVLLVAGVTPQPYLNDTLKMALFGSQDAFFAAKGALVSISRAVLTAKHHPPGTSDPPSDLSAADNAPHAAPETLAHSKPATGRQVLRHDRTQATTRGHQSTRRARSSPTSNEHRYWRPGWDYLDKTEHLAAFTVLALLTGLAYRQVRTLRRLTALAALAASIQTLQLFSVTREPDLADLQADIAGVVLGTLSAGLLLYLYRSTRALSKRRASGSRCSPEAPDSAGSSDRGRHYER